MPRAVKAHNPQQALSAGARNMAVLLAAALRHQVPVKTVAHQCGAALLALLAVHGAVPRSAMVAWAAARISSLPRAAMAVQPARPGRRQQQAVTAQQAQRIGAVKVAAVVAQLQPMA
jgi:hypothetical protein